MKRIRVLSVVLLAAIGLSRASPLSAAPERQLVTLSAIPTSSALFPYVVALARTLSTHCPEFSFIVTDSNGNVDNTRQIRSGEVTIAHSGSPVDYESYYGTGKIFGGKPFRDFRILWYYERSLFQICAAQDSGIKTLRDLEGRPFSAGGTGTAAEEVIRLALDALGIHPAYFESGQPEAADAYVARQIDGLVKFGPVPDHYITSVHNERPVRFLSFSDEEMEQVLMAVPYVKSGVLPENAYKNVAGGTRCLVGYSGIQTGLNFTQEQGYRLFKAMWESGKAVWQRAYPLGEKNDVPALTLEGAMTPLHPGTVQYLVEQGYSVPENLIPEEYVPPAP